MTSTAHRPKAETKPRSLTHISDDLSVLKGENVINEAIENLHSDDPERQASGEAQLQALLQTEDDLREACNRLLWSASKDDVYAGSLQGEIDAMSEQLEMLKKQQQRHVRRAADKRIYACGHLDHHFPDEKTHVTPFGNLGMLKTKPSVVNNDGKPLGIKDIPEDYEWLISTEEKTTTRKVIDTQKILNGLMDGQKFSFARFKKPSTRFY